MNLQELIEYKKARHKEYKSRPRTSFRSDIEDAMRVGEITGLLIAQAILEAEKTDYLDGYAVIPKEKYADLKRERDDYFRIIEERGIQITDLCEQADRLKRERDRYRAALVVIVKQVLYIPPCGARSRFIRETAEQALAEPEPEKEDKG